MRAFRPRVADEAMVRRSGVMKVAALLGALVLAGCRNCGGGTSMVETRFRVAPETQSVDFGRVLEGTMVTKQVTLIAETRASVSVGATTMTPFSSAPLVDIPGGSQVDLDVVFRAGNGESNGELVLTSGRQEVRVGLRGVGVRPPVCIPSATCRMSAYSLELDRCVETMSPDETACEPTSQCLEQGRCRMGECLGVARRCNDNDACTSDACSMDAGCINTRIVCPQPTTPCRVPTCDARMGCGEAMAPDGMPCGTSNCVSSKLCISGSCQEIATPDGTECAPAIACYGISRCKSQKCERPDAGEWLPAWSARIEGQPLSAPPALLSFGGGTVFFTVCGLTPLPVDAGLMDAGAVDAGVEDAGVDAGELDGGDAGTDAGVDAGFDAGFDAGPPTECALVSYTGTGFERFTARSTLVEQLSHVGPAGVVLRVDGGILFRARAMGSLLGGWETGSVSAPRVAMLRDGGVLVAMRGDGGTHLVMTSTMSAEQLAFLPEDITHVATGLDDTVFALSSSASLTRLGLGADGGFLITTLQLDAGPTPMLATAGESTVAFDQLVQWSAAGFLPPRPFEAPPDAGQQSRDVVITPSTVFLFFKGCVSLSMSCLPEDEVGWVRAFSRNTGALLWEDLIFPARARGRLVEATALRIPGGIESALAAVIEGEIDGGVVNGLVVNVDGGRALECPFPEGTGRLIAGTFAGGQLVTLATRPDGGVTLEGWPLGALPLETSGWVSAEGASGQRRPTP